jgi:hypothetical protein
MRAALAALMLALAAGCGNGAQHAPDPAEQPLVKRYASPGVPKAADLPCFKCHDYAKWGETAGRFPHLSEAHKDVGHCHVCHVGIAHHGTTIARATCLGCHEEPVPLLGPAQQAAAKP